MHLLQEWLLPIFLYAETHYKFKGIYSQLIKNEPEIIADAPFRVEKDKRVPILIFIKDAHRFPIELRKIKIEMLTNKTSIVHTFDLCSEIIAQKFFHRIFFIQPPKNFVGKLGVDVEMELEIRGKVTRYKNDNYRISSHAPLKILVAENKLPRFKNLYFGDIHWHSNYTDDMVEFGAPIAAALEMAKAIGMDFFAVTDHSYDLDDEIDNWLRNDVKLPKWHRMKKEISELTSSEKDFVILQGEEVSAGNHRNKNVHLLILNEDKFFPGKGDGAEKWLRNKPDMGISEILDQLDTRALAIAGHPEIPFPFLQKFFLRRGAWEKPDYKHSNLIGFQIWNGEQDHSFYHGSEKWKELLLEGKRLALFAGNDAHGNFNRYRQIGFPFLTLVESESQVFGKMRTGVFVTQAFNVQSLLAAMKKGKTLVTNGPVGAIFIKNEEGRRAEIGDEINGKNFQIHIRAKSSPEFGSLKKIKLIFGSIVEKVEKSIFDFQPKETDFDFQGQISFSSHHSNGYFRLEITSEKAGKIFRCLTSPIYLAMS